MNASALVTARPPGCAIAWATPDAIFVEIPHKNGGPPFIVRHRRSLQGLAAALNILVEHAEPPLLRSDPNANHPSINKIEPNKKAKEAATWATEQQRERAREILRKMGKI